MNTDRCPACGSRTVVAPGIGPYCPNKKCDRIDDLRPASGMIAGGGFALMAWRLAQQRAYPTNYEPYLPCYPDPRKVANDPASGAYAGRWYYAILDVARDSFNGRVRNPGWTTVKL